MVAHSSEHCVPVTDGSTVRDAVELQVERVCELVAAPLLLDIMVAIVRVLVEFQDNMPGEKSYEDVLLPCGIIGAQAVFHGLSILHAFVRVISDLHLTLLQTAANSRIAPMSLLREALKRIKPDFTFPDELTVNVLKPIFRQRGLPEEFAQQIQYDMNDLN